MKPLEKIDNLYHHAGRSMDLTPVNIPAHSMGLTGLKAHQSSIFRELINNEESKTFCN
jgi:hypothetical protein